MRADSLRFWGAVLVIVGGVGYLVWDSIRPRRIEIEGEDSEIVQAEKTKADRAGDCRSRLPWSAAGGEW